MDALGRSPQGSLAADGDVHPGLDAEALYTRGMAHYRRREWGQAMDCFSQLKTVDPNHPGIDALLDELEWFIQLQAIEPESQTEAVTAPSVSLPKVATRFQPVEDGKPLPIGARTGRRFPWQGILWTLVALIVVGGVYWLVSRPQTDPKDELYNRAQARMSRHDYAGAIQAFEELLVLDPNNKAAQVGIDKARRLQNLGAMYAKVQELVSQQRWDDAATELKRILQLDSSYEDAATLYQRVETERVLASLLSEAKQYNAEGQWAKAAEKLEQVKSTDATYHENEVRDLLFDSYLNDGRTLIQDANQGTTPVQAAIQRFSSALGIRPQDQEAGDQKRMATALLDAYALFDTQAWQAMILKVKPLYDVSASYGGGAAARLLYQSYVGLGDQYRDGKNYLLALEQYRSAQGLAEVDTSLAAGRERELMAALVTATPTATATVPPTATPAAYQTPTVYNTPVPPTATTPGKTAPPPPPPPTSPPPPPTATLTPAKTAVPSATPQPTATVPQPTSTRPPRN